LFRRFDDSTIAGQYVDAAGFNLKPIPGDNATLFAVRASAGHYSNGQSGCLFLSQVYDEKSEKCVGSGDVQNLNTKDGSFSTHYLEYGGTFASIRLDSDLVETRRISIDGSVRWNPAFLAVLGGMDDELERVYGRWSFQSGLALKQQGILEGIRYTLHSSLDLDCATRKWRPCRAIAKAGISFPALYGFGIFASSLVGSDYYNTGFATPLSNGRRIGPLRGPIIGVMIDHSRLLTLSTRGAVKRVETRRR
jgi:hypothetical protein